MTNNAFEDNIARITSTPKFLNTLAENPVTDAANVIDTSGNSHDGTYKGTWNSSQRVSKGHGWILSPNGTDNYISIGNSDDFSFGNGVSDIPFTIAGTIQLSSTASQAIIAKYNTIVGSQYREWILGTYDDGGIKLYLLLYDESSDGSVNRDVTNTISAGFHSYVVTYDGSGGANAANGIKIYIDGIEVSSIATNNINYTAMENLSSDVYIGSYLAAGTLIELIVDNFTPPIVDKNNIWTEGKIKDFHQYVNDWYVSYDIIDNIETMLSDNWNISPTPTFDKMINLKRIDYRDANYILVYEYNHNQQKKGFTYDFIRRNVTLSIDIRTKNSYIDLRLMEAEVMRIFHLKRKNPITNYDKLEIIRRTDLSDESVLIYHVVIDIELKKLFEAL